MARDHAAVNDQALALAKKLGVTPADNPTSQSLAEGAAAEQKKLAALSGAAYDRAYADNEVAFHKAVLAALDGTLIPATQKERKTFDMGKSVTASVDVEGCRRIKKINKKKRHED